MSDMDPLLEAILREYNGTNTMDLPDIANILKDELPAIEGSTEGCSLTEGGSATYTGLCALQVGQGGGGGGGGDGAYSGFLDHTQTPEVPNGQQVVMAEPSGQQVAMAEPYGQQVAMAEPYGQQVVMAEPYGQQVVMAGPSGQLKGQLMYLSGTQEIVFVQEPIAVQEDPMNGQVPFAPSPEAWSPESMSVASPSQVVEEPPKKKRGRKRKDDLSSGSSSSTRQKKLKVHEIMTPFEDEEQERKRRNAHNAKRHRDLQKQKMEELKGERDALQLKVSQMEQKVAQLIKQLACQKAGVYTIVT